MQQKGVGSKDGEGKEPRQGVSVDLWAVPGGVSVAEI